MRTQADIVIDFLGGSTAVSRMLESPVTTVHSWRSNGIPRSRMAHLRLAAKVAGKPLPSDLSEIEDVNPDADAGEPEPVAQC